MKKLAIMFAAGAAAVTAGSAAYADNAVKSRPSTDATQSRIATQSSTDISSRHRHWRHHHWGHHHYRPYYNSYSYYRPRPYGYYGPRYYGGGPGISFSFGTGGYRGWY
jgi:hypothetical protein